VVTIERISPGQYRVDSDAGPRSIIVTLPWLNGLLRAMLEAGMVDRGQLARTPPRR